MVTQTMSEAKIAVNLTVKDAQGLLAFLISGQDVLDLELEQRWRGAIVEALAKAAEEKTTGVKMFEEGRGVSRVLWRSSLRSFLVSSRPH